ncbi:MAG TPA: DUF6152 family protein [Gammaproteobacteria bacterium]|jgi:hypothetical protein
MIRIALPVFTSAALAASIAVAHHSAVAFFDESDKQEIAGEVTMTRWRNPHVSFGVTVTADDGSRTEWTVESNALNALERIGISPDTVRVSDQVRVWGPVSRHGQPLIRAYNLLLGSGEEVVMMPHVSIDRRWAGSDLVEATPELASADTAAAEREADGIFRVWTHGRVNLINDELPLTAAAAEKKAAFNPLIDDPVLRCIPTGMPAVMDVTFPVEFIRQGEDIVLRLEQWDTVRTIHMGGDPSDAEGQPATREGYSVGRWDGDVLAVETSNIDWMYFDDRGTPLSSAARVVERFTLSDDENSLHWQATTTDPETFTEPVLQEQTFTWVPGEQIKPYECATAY